MKKILIFLIATLMSVSCATVSNKDKKTIHNIDNDNVAQEIIESKSKKLTEVKKKEDVISIYRGTEKIGELSLDEFEAIIKASSSYEKILEAEKEKRVYVFFKDNPWELKPGKSVNTEVYIIWKDKKETPLKKVILKLTMEVPKEGQVMSKIRILYRDVAEIGFPVSVGILILVLGLVFGL